jgi:membrane-associated protease RseP (regulator of RpoE activity)
MVRQERYVLHLLLFALTLLTTTIVGAALSQSFSANRAIDIEQELTIFRQIWMNPLVLLTGLPFSLTLLSILLAHELGHYLTCILYRIDASLPYFLPAPTPIGTLGAFIRIRSPIYTRHALFDVGVAGPIAGFVLLVPALLVGLLQSKVVHGIADRGDLVFGNPLILRVFEWMLFPGVSSSDIFLHPVARAAWVGILATGLNLLPIGQLDGGHILYSFFGGYRHKILSRVFVAALAPLAFLWVNWIIWAVLLAIFGLRHPVICDVSPLSQGRRRLGFAALAIFILCFMPVPFRT